MKNEHEFIEEIPMDHFNSFITPVQFNSIIMKKTQLISNLQEKGMKQIFCPEALVSFQRIRSAPVS